MYNLNEMTEQEVFDAVKDHLLSQGRQSLDKERKCAYRGIGGLKCAAGIFIPDELYKRTLENLRWEEVSYKLGLTIHQDLIESLQSIHDDANDECQVVRKSFEAELEDESEIEDKVKEFFDDPDYLVKLWEMRLRQLATDRGLTY
jgi:hypothetical protein